MGKIALLALMGVFVSAGLPSAAEPAAGEAPTTRQRPDHRPVLTDTAKAAAVQAGAGLRARAGSGVPGTAAPRSGKITAGGGAIPSGQAATTLETRGQNGPPPARPA